MIGDAAIKLAGNRRDLSTSARNCVSSAAIGQRFGTPPPVRIVEEEAGVFGANLVGTGA